MLFNKGNTRTPFSSMISGKTEYTNSVEFVLGQEYTSEDGEIPAISENASLKAPDASFITRKQNTNVTQIFQDSVAISYAKESNMATLSGANIAGQQANPLNELDFQVANKMKKMARSIEKTFIQGKYNKATTDETINKTRGIDQAIVTNVVTAEDKPLDIWMLNDLVEKIDKSNGDISNLTLWCDNNTLNQIHGNAIEMGVEVGAFRANEYGIQIRDIYLPTTTVHIAVGQFIPEGTAYLLNFDAIAPVEQLVPGKGNFFLEELAKQGAGTKYQIFGQIGLDYGNEALHGKITGLSTTFDRPKGKKVVLVDSTAEATVTSTKATK